MPLAPGGMNEGGWAAVGNWGWTPGPLGCMGGCMGILGTPLTILGGGPTGIGPLGMPGGVAKGIFTDPGVPWTGIPT
jgi:hypothetical protein